jgi:hypothetical protein
MKEITLNKYSTESFSKATLRRMKHTDCVEQRVRCFLIGQLGKNYSINTTIGLKDILDGAMVIVLKARELIGCRTVILDCEAPLVELYVNCGFTVLPIVDDKSTSLTTLYKMII